MTLSAHIVQCPLYNFKNVSLIISGRSACCDELKRLVFKSVVVHSPKEASDVIEKLGIVEIWNVIIETEGTCDELKVVSDPVKQWWNQCVGFVVVNCVVHPRITISLKVCDIPETCLCACTSSNRFTGFGVVHKREYLAERDYLSHDETTRIFGSYQGKFLEICEAYDAAYTYPKAHYMRGRSNINSDCYFEGYECKPTGLTNDDVSTAYFLQKFEEHGLIGTYFDKIPKDVVHKIFSMATSAYWIDAEKAVSSPPEAYTTSRYAEFAMDDY